MRFRITHLLILTVLVAIVVAFPLQTVRPEGVMIALVVGLLIYWESHKQRRQHDKDQNSLA